MDYADLIGLALQGRSINSTANALGIPLATFQRYAAGTRFPDFDAGLKIVQAAGVDLAEGFVVIAEAQREYKKRKNVMQDE